MLIWKNLESCLMTSQIISKLPKLVTSQKHNQITETVSPISWALTSSTTKSFILKYLQSPQRKPLYSPLTQDISQTLWYNFYCYFIFLSVSLQGHMSTYHPENENSTKVPLLFLLITTATKIVYKEHIGDYFPLTSPMVHHKLNFFLLGSTSYTLKFPLGNN